MMILISLGTAAIAGAMQGPVVQATDEAPEACARVNASITRLIVSPAVARQGATLSVRVETPMGPYNPVPVPRECLGDWRVTPAGSARFSDDHAALTVAPEAPAGTLLEISVAAQGYVSGRVSRLMTLIGADAFVLTGVWRQLSVACQSGFQPDQPVRELEFLDGGGFKLTYAPFETYVDYWGGFEWDPSAESLTLTVTGGNRPPGLETLSTRAVVDDGRLVLDGVFLGDHGPQRTEQACRYVFERP